MPTSTSTSTSTYDIEEYNFIEESAEILNQIILYLKSLFGFKV
jgi:hypothetical protein